MSAAGTFRELQSSQGMRFASCPPAFGLLLYLRKAHTPTALAKYWSGQNAGRKKARI